MSEYIPKYPSHEGDDSNKSSSELLAETLKPIYVPQDLMLAWESHLAGYSRDTHVLLDQVKDSETALNTQYQALLTRVQKYEQMLQDITMDSNEFLMDSDEENFTGWNILAQASYWDYLLKKEITKLSDLINGVGSRGELVSDISNEILEGLIADNNYISNVIEALSDTPLIRELADALNTTTSSLSDLQDEYVRLARKQAADAEALANQQVEKAEQLVDAINASIAEQLDRIAQEAAIRTQLLQELEDRANAMAAQAEADAAELYAQVDSIREGAAADKAGILETVNNYKTELKSDIATVNTELLGALDGVNTLVTEVRDENGVTLNELTTYKASNDVAVAGLVSKITTNISDTAANASKITGLTTQLATTNTELGTVRNTSANALSKANTAVTANSALATRVDSLAAAITDLGEGAETTVDVYAFNALKAEVHTNAAGVTSLVEQVDALGTSYTDLADGVEANTDAVSTLTVKQSEMNGDISQLSSDVTYLTSELGVTNTALNTKASNQALSNLNTKLTTTDGKVAANTQQLTQLNTDLTTVRDGLETKASTEALNDLATEVVELEGGLAVNASAITSLKSEIDTELDKKATVTAVNGLTTKVNEVEGKTTTNANNLLALNTSVGNVVKGLANKLDASTISDYYTKSQADDKAAEVAAGKVEEFSASISNEHLQELLVDGNKPAYSNGSLYQVAGFTMKEAREVGSTYTLRFKMTINRDGNDTTSYIRAYQGGNAALIRNYTEADSTIFEVTFTASAFSPANEIRFYHFPNNPSAKEGTSVTVHWASLVKAEDDAKAQTQAALTANSTAIQNTSAEVARVDGRVTATNSAQTLLEGRVQTVEGGISKKADASALSSLDTRVGTVEGQYTTQASDITRLNNSLDTTNVNVGTAQTAAQNAMNAAGAKGKVIFGNTAPAVADRLVQNLWIDTTSNANTPKRWNGSAWVVVTDKVATDAAKAVSDLDTVVKTKADVTALNSLTTKVTDDAKKTVANTNSITELNSDIVKINNDLATKANASALSDMYTKNEVDDKAAEIAAGEVNKYDAGLVIGGVNTIPNSFDIPQYSNDSSRYPIESAVVSGVRRIRRTGAASNTLSNYTGTFVDFPIGTEYTISVKVKPIGSDYSLGFYGASASTKLCKADQWTTLQATYKATAQPERLRALVSTEAQVGVWLEVKEWQAEIGNKATAWSPANEDIQSQLDVNASAIQATNVEVVKVDDKTISNTNSIIKLNSDVTGVKNGLATKANTSALNDYYTKTETNDVATTAAAGEVSKYDANLVIGGNNLLLNSNFAAAASTDKWASNGGGFTKVTDPIHGSVLQTNLPSGLVHAWLKLENGVEYTYSALIKPSTAITMGNSNPLHYHAGLNNVNQAKIQVLAKSHSVIPANTWSRIWIKFKLTSDANSFKPHIYGGATTVIQLAWTQLELGGKATDWTTNSAEIQSSIDVNASAIKATNSEVERVDGRVTTTNEDITGLKNRMTTAEGTKASVSAVNALTTRVGDVEGGLETAANNITSLKSSIAGTAESITANGSQATLDVIGFPVANVSLSTNADSMTGSLIKLRGQVHTPITNSKLLIDPTKLYKLRMRYRRTAGATNGIYVAIINYNAAGDRTVASDNVLNPVGTPINRANYPIANELPALNTWREVEYYFKGKSTGGSSGSGTLTSPRKFPALAATVDIGVLANYVKGNDLTQEYEIDYLIFEDAAGSVNAEAITNTNTEVSRINDVVKGHVSDIRDLKTNIAGKADASALNALTVRVEDEEGKSSSQATEVTDLKASVSTLGKQTLTKESVLDLTALNVDTYYPVLLPLGDVSTRHRMQVSAILNTTNNGNPSWGTHNSGFSCTYDWESNGSAWGAYTINRIIHIADSLYAGNQSPAIDISQLRNSSREYIFLRGGGKYTLRTSGAVGTPQLITASTTFNTQIIAPKPYDKSLEITTSLDSKAGASAVNTLTAQVDIIDGNVSTHAESLILLKSDNADNKNALQVQGKVIDGVKANYMVKMETNGVIGGFGLMQTSGALGQVKTSFGVNADSFFIGAPASKKQPFIVTTTNQVVDGVTYPAGTYIDVALIAKATIGNAHIADASITNAKIKELDASKITTGTLDAKRIRIGSTTQFDSGFAPSEVLNDAKSYTDAIEVGGRNLAINTGTGLWVTYGSGVTITNSTGSDGNRITKVVQTTTATGGIQQSASDRSMSLETNGKYIISFDIRSNVASAAALLNYVYIMHSVGGNQSVSFSEFALSSTNFTRVSASFTKTGTSPTSYVMISSLTNAVNDWFEVKNVKVEKGNKATDWTPAPEDVADQIAAKARTFTTTPTTPYTSGDLYRNGSAIYVCTNPRATGSYVAGDWTLVGDVTANNKSADTGKVNGVAAATVVANAANGAAVYSDVMSDLKITPVEKTAINQEWNRIQKEYASLLAQAQALSLTTTTYTSAYTGLSTTAPSMSSILSSMSTTTTLTAAQRDAYKTQYTTYYTQAVAITKAINDKIAANAKADLDSLEIGGRNLLPDSNKFVDASVSKVVGGVNYRVVGYAWSYFFNAELPSATYTLSVMVHNPYSDARQARLSGGGFNLYKVIAPNSTELFSQTISGAISGRFYILGATSDLMFSYAKLEKGSKATDWTPAPEDVDTAIATKAKTFTSQPVPPYTSGDLWRNGSTIRVCTVSRASGSYVAADWTLVGDVTSANTAANSNQLGGKASATVLGDITNAKNAADAAGLKATAADNQLALWKYPNSTYIDGGKIYTNSITANQINVTNLSSLSSNLGTIKVDTANIATGAINTAQIGNLQVSTLKIADRAVTVPHFYVDTAPVSINNQRFSSFPKDTVTNNWIIPTISGLTLGGFSAYADVLVMCDVKLVASINAEQYRYDSEKQVILDMSRNVKRVPATSRVTARLLAGYYDTGLGGETGDAQIIGVEATDTRRDDSDGLGILGTRLELGGTYTRRLKADSSGRIAISLWVSSYGTTSSNHTLEVTPRGSIVWYVQELKK